MAVQLTAAVRQLLRWCASALAAWGAATVPGGMPASDPRRCAACRRPFACPVAWEPEGETHWRIELRCGDCGHRHELVLTNADTACLEQSLAADECLIARAAERLDAERMAVEADAFVHALTRDLIVADDFAAETR
jgi:hypothetical protein